MRWSQLKKRLKERIAPSLAASLDLNQTRYRHSHDQEGEFWISAGDDRIYSAGSMTYLDTLGKLVAEHRDQGASINEAYDQMWPVLDARSLMLLEQINKDLFNSLSLTVEEMLEQHNPVIRALALVDARYGKRRLAAFDPADEHPLVQRLFHLRCAAEGVRYPGLSPHLR